MVKTKLVLLGPVGNGKSTTGNNLLHQNVFTSGRDVAAITRVIQKGENENLAVIDCPGFGDHFDESLFYREFLRNEERFLQIAPIDAFLMLIKFDIDSSEGFFYAARDFVSSFGAPGIISLVLVCIQSNPKRRFGNADFERVLKNSDGYRFLKRENENHDIQWCLWENLQNEYPDQLKNLFACIFRVQPFKRDFFKFSFQMVKNKLQPLTILSK